MPDFLAEVLSLPHNSGYRLGVKTAKEWGVPPTKLLGGPKREEDWSSVDRLLAMALTILESETCGQCNTPVWLGYSTDNALQFKLESRTCYSCAELEKARKEQEKNKASKPSPGESRYVVPYKVIDGQPLPSRKDFFAKKRK